MKLGGSALINGLILALALASSVLVFVTEEKPTTEELEERARNLLPVFPRAELDAISVKRGSQSYRVRADGERFVFEGSGAAEVDADAITAWLRSLELAGFVRRLEADADDRSALGLNEPFATLGLEFASARYELRFGKEAKTPAGTRYLELKGPDFSRTYLVRSDLASELVLDKDALRPTALLRFPFSEIRALSWQEGRGPLHEVTRRSSVEFTNPKGERLRRETLDRLGLELARTKSAHFTSDAAATTALAADPEALRITLSPAGEQAENVLRIGGRCPEDPTLEVLQRERPHPSAECVNPELRKTFRAAGEALVDDSPFVLRMDEVENLRLERNGKTLELARRGSAFRLLAPAEQDVELDTGNGRLEELVRARGERLATPRLPELGLSPPEGTLRLRSSVVEGTSKFDDVVEIGRPQRDGRLPVRRVRDGVTLLLPATSAAAYSVDSTLLKSRHVFDFGPSELKSLTLESGGERQLLRRVEDSYELVEPKGFTHDGERVLDLVQGLATLLADRWVADEPEAHHGLSRPKAVLTLELAGKESTPKRVTLKIGADTPGGAFASIDSQPGVFVLPRAFVTQTTTLLLSRAVFELEPSNLSSVTLSSPRGTLELRRSGDTFVPKGSPLSPAAVERIVQTLANLRAESALHTGPARPNEGFATPTLSLRVTPVDTTQKAKTIQIGSAVTERGQKLFHARIEGTPATYLVPASTLDELLNAL